MPSKTLFNFLDSKSLGSDKINSFCLESLVLAFTKETKKCFHLHYSIVLQQYFQLYTNPLHCYSIYWNQLSFSLNQPTGPIQSLSCVFRLCVCLCVCATFCVKNKRFISPIYKCCKSNQSIKKIFITEKFRKEIGLRLNNFGSEMVKNCWGFFSFLVCLSFPQIVYGSRSQSAAASYCA